MAEYHLKSMSPPTAAEEENLPRRGLVTDVRREWLMHEDQALAYRLQNEEYNQHLGHNKSRNAILRHDTPHAREEQVRVDEEAARQQQQMLEDLDRQEARDAAMAAAVAARLEEDEQQERERRERQDREMARQLAAAEKARIKERKELKQVEREAAYLGINTGRDNVALLAAAQTDTTAPSTSAAATESKPSSSSNTAAAKPAVHSLSSSGPHSSGGGGGSSSCSGGGSASAAAVPGPSGSGRSRRPMALTDEDLNDLSDFCLQPSEDMDEEEARRLQEEQDAEVARLLGDQEVKRRGDCLPQDQLMAIQAQDQELAKVLQEQERAKAKKAREKARQKALLKKQLKRQQQEQARLPRADQQRDTGAGGSGIGHPGTSHDTLPGDLDTPLPPSHLDDPARTGQSGPTTHTGSTNSINGAITGCPSDTPATTSNNSLVTSVVHRPILHRVDSEHFYDTPDDDLTQRLRSPAHHCHDDGEDVPPPPRNDGRSGGARVDAIRTAPAGRSGVGPGPNSTPDMRGVSDFQSPYSLEVVQPYASHAVAQSRLAPQRNSPLPRVPSPVSSSHNTTQDSSFDDMGHHYDTPSLLLSRQTGGPTSESPPNYDQPILPVSPHRTAAAAVVSPTPMSQTSKLCHSPDHVSRPTSAVSPPHDVLRYTRSPPPTTSPPPPMPTPSNSNHLMSPHHRHQSSIVSNTSSTTSNPDRALAQSPHSRINSPSDVGPTSSRQNDVSNRASQGPADVQTAYREDVASAQSNRVACGNKRTDDRVGPVVSPGIGNRGDGDGRPSIASTSREHLDISHTPNVKQLLGQASSTSELRRRSVAEVMGRLQNVNIHDGERDKRASSGAELEAYLPPYQERAPGGYVPPTHRPDQLPSPAHSGSPLPQYSLHSPSPSSVHSPTPSTHPLSSPTPQMHPLSSPVSPTRQLSSPNGPMSSSSHPLSSPTPPIYPVSSPTPPAHQSPIPPAVSPTSPPQRAMSPASPRPCGQSPLPQSSLAAPSHHSPHSPAHSPSAQDHHHHHHHQQLQGSRSPQPPSSAVMQQQQQQQQAMAYHHQQQQQQHHQHQQQQQQAAVLASRLSGGFTNIACAIDPTYQRRVMQGQLPPHHHHHHLQPHHHHHHAPTAAGVQGHMHHHHGHLHPAHHHAAMEASQHASHLHPDQQMQLQQMQQEQHLQQQQQYLQQQHEHQMQLEQQYHQEQMQQQLYLQQQQQQLYQQNLESSEQFPAPPYMPIQGQRRPNSLEKSTGPRLAELRGGPGVGEGGAAQSPSPRGKPARGAKQGAACKQQ